MSERSRCESTVNTSTIPLSGDATFTGGWQETVEPDIMCQLKTDADCTLYFDFSPILLRFYLVFIAVFSFESLSSILMVVQ